MHTASWALNLLHEKKGGKKGGYDKNLTVNGIIALECS